LIFYLIFHLELGGVVIEGDLVSIGMK